MSQIVVRLESDETEWTDDSYRVLQRELRGSGIDSQSIGAADRVDGAKGAMSVVEGVVVPIVAGTIPAIAAIVIEWARSRRQHCTVILEKPDGIIVEVDDVALDRLDSVIAEMVKPGGPDRT